MRNYLAHKSSEARSHGTEDAPDSVRENAAGTEQDRVPARGTDLNLLELVEWLHLR